MVSRFTGAGLGLFAFAVTLLAGLVVGNPINVILARSILALFLFFALGALLGLFAQKVIDEHQKRREANWPAPDSESKNDAEPPGGRNGATVPNSA